MNPPQRLVSLLLRGLLLLVLTGCASVPRHIIVTTTNERFPVDTILNAKNGQPISYEALIEDLSDVRVVYVGEIHTNAEHHRIQQRIIEALHEQHGAITVGMEMFDHRYDPVLDEWRTGALDRAAFIEKTHWYVPRSGWGFDFDLYAPIFETLKSRKISFVGLNVPFWIPSKISASGIANLLPDERRLIADRIDTDNAAHRAYVESVFNQNPHHGLKSFDYFYEAQCAWEDTMAESIARKLGEAPMVVVIGNGHIQYKYGVPERANARKPTPYRTVYLAPVGMQVDFALADYIWVTP
jgi:uncharacterized iron-regulated protein